MGFSHFRSLVKGSKKVDSGLGPHANEERMPRWLIRVLKESDKTTSRETVGPDGEKVHRELRSVETPGLIPALALLSRTDPKIVQAYYCSPEVHHVAKMRREGSFCGYRNIQMLISYICNSNSPGHQIFGGEPIPSIFLLQDMIEKAWDKGFNASSRDEIGSLRMTRKFIGTSEVDALFRSLDIPVTAKGFESTPQAEACQSLLQHVSAYFKSTDGISTDDRVTITHKAPIFLQRPGHSMTIIGIEEDTQGSHNLLVFDPDYKPATSVKKIASGMMSPEKPEKLLKHHRCGLTELAKFDAFEILQLNEHVVVLS